MAKSKHKKKTAVTGEIVLSAIKKLTKNTGWTARTIVKFIRMEYGIDEKNIGLKVSRALKRGVCLGLFQMEGNRYRLNNMASLAVPMPTTARLLFKDRPLRLRSLSGMQDRGPRY